MVFSWCFPLVLPPSPRQSQRAEALNRLRALGRHKNDIAFSLRVNPKALLPDAAVPTLPCTRPGWCPPRGAERGWDTPSRTTPYRTAGTSWEPKSLPAPRKRHGCGLPPAGSSPRAGSHKPTCSCGSRCICQGGSSILWPLSHSIPSFGCLPRAWPRRHHASEHSRRRPARSAACGLGLELVANLHSEAIARLQIDSRCDLAGNLRHSEIHIQLVLRRRRQPHGIREGGRYDGARQLIRLLRLLGYFHRENSGGLLGQFHHESDGAECLGFPVRCVAAHAPQLRVGFPNAGREEEGKCLNLRDELGGHHVDIGIVGVFS